MCGRWIMLYCFFSDCESLVRKMLVRDPAKRYTMAMVKRHTWMQADAAAAEGAKVRAAAFAEAKAAKAKIAGSKAGGTGINEQILRVMHSLGIDPVRTTEVVNLILFCFEARMTSLFPVSVCEKRQLRPPCRHLLPPARQAG